MLVERVADVKGLLGRHVPQTRQVLRKLIPDTVIDGKRVPGRILCTPFDDARGRGYTLSARGTYAGLLSEKILVNYGGGEGALLQSFNEAFSFELRGVALVVSLYVVISCRLAMYLSFS